MHPILTSYKGNLLWLPRHTCYLSLSGSRAYRTNTPESDIDFKGFTLVPKTYRNGFLLDFEQTELKEVNSSWFSDQKLKCEGTIYNIDKFFQLASFCNPNIIELLYTDEEDLFHINKYGRIVRDNRDLFLSRKALYTFTGYATAQMKRISGHRRWLLQPPEKLPERKEFGLPSEYEIPKNQLSAALDIVQKKMDAWEIDYGAMEDAEKIRLGTEIKEFLSEVYLGSSEKFQSAARILGFEENFIEYITKEREFRAKKHEWHQYQEWKKTRNPDRAVLEAKYLIDTKHASHLVRLCKMCREILTEGKVYTARPDKDSILSIRNGAWSYDQLVEWFDKEEKELIKLAKFSSLPREPDRNKLNNLLCEIYEEFDDNG